MRKIKGKPVSSGIVIGRALIFNSQAKIVLKEKINTELVDTEIKRLNNAVRKTRSQLKKIFQDLSIKKKTRYSSTLRSVLKIWISLTQAGNYLT